MDNSLYFKAYITNLGKYNEGELVGEWVQFPIDEDDFQTVLDRIGISPMYEEWFVTDYDCSLESFDWTDLGEYPGFEGLEHFGELINSITDIEAVDNVYEVSQDLELAIEGIENGSYIYHPGISNNQEWGQFIVDEYYGGVEHLGTDAVERYFDYEALGRDLNLDSYGEDNELSAGEYFCGDEDASDTEIGETYVEDIGIEGVVNPENYFDYEYFGRDNAYNCTFTKDGLVEEV